MGDEAKSAIPAIADLLGDRAPIDNGEVWIVAAETLGGMGGEATLQAVMPLLVPSDEDVRYRAACLVLYTMGEEAVPALPTLVEILEAKQEPLGPPLYSVEGMGPAGAEAIPALIPLLDHENFHYQYFVCKVLGAMGESAKPAVPKLIDRLENGLPSVRRHAATALGDIGQVAGEEAVLALTAALSDPLAPVRQDAARALGQFGNSARSAVPALKEAVENPSFPARVDAAASLWKIDPSHQDLVVKTLFEELEGDDEAWTAARELGLLAEEAKIVDRVLGMLDSATPEMKEQVVEMVGWLGSAGRPALEKLRAIRADESAEPDLREAAREAIERIETNRAGD
jgi:HEAT repeat protein